MAKRVWCQRHQVLALEVDDAGGMQRRRIGKEPQNGQGSDRFAGARLADKRHGLSLADVEGDLFNRMGDLAAAVKIDGEVFDADESFSRRGKLGALFCIAPSSIPSCSLA